VNGKPDNGETATADDGRGFDPREAAALLEQADAQARRQFQHGVALAAYTAAQ